jgi:hypothetical protein
VHKNNINCLLEVDSSFVVELGQFNAVVGRRISEESRAKTLGLGDGQREFRSLCARLTNSARIRKFGSIRVYFPVNQYRVEVGSRSF